MAAWTDRRGGVQETHAGRKFFDLAWLKKAPIAVEAVLRIDELFDIEREINGEPPHERRRRCHCRRSAC